MKGCWRGSGGGRAAVAAGACVLMVAVLFVPYLTNGMWFDDALNSQIRSMVHRFDSSLWSFTGRVIRKWLDDYGRILFSWPIVYGFFYAIRETWQVRLIDMALVVAHIGSVAYLLRLLKVPTATVGLFVVLLVPLFQIRNTHDPIASYAAFCQFQGIILTMALALLVRWRLTERTSFLAASSLIASLSLTTYELNLVYVPIALGTAWFSGRKNMARDSAIVLVPVGAYFAASAYVKLTAHTPYMGSSISSSWAMPATYLKQLVGTLPGSFYLLEGRPAYPLPDLLRDLVTSKAAWVLLVAAFISMFSLTRTSEAPRRSWPRGTVLGAAALVMLPPLLISVSAKYQAELTWGSAYLPVYYQYFGLAILAAIGLHALPVRHVGSRTAVAGLFAIYVAANWTVNLRQSFAQDQIFDEPRTSLVAAMKAGLLDAVHDGDVVRIESQPMWINGNLIFETLQKRVVIPNELAIKDWFEPQERQNAAHFRLFRKSRAWQLAAEPGVSSEPE